MDTTLLIIALTLSVSAFVQATTGFGFALLAVAILPLVMGVNEAIALIAIFNLAVSSVALFFNWSGFAWRETSACALGADPYPGPGDDADPDRFE